MVMIHDRGEVDYFGSRDTYTLDCGHYRLDYLAVIALYKLFLNFYMDHCAIVLPSGLTSRHSVLGVGVVPSREAEDAVSTKGELDEMNSFYPVECLK
jgi:hypothetical protein